MKYLSLIAFAFTLSFSSLFAQSIRFLDVVQKPGREVAVEAHINERGGYISFDRVYRSGCTGGYKVKVTFSNSVNMLQPQETFQVTLSCEHCNTPCGYKWGIVELFPANNVTSIDQYPDYVYNENIELVSTSNGSSGVADWAAGRQNNIFTLKYNPKKEVPLTAIKIRVASEHDILIVFASEGHKVPDTSSQSIPVSDSTGKPDLSCAWNSTYGKIYWDEGYYSSKNKTFSGELFKKDGIWVYEGTWSRNGGSSQGRIFFEFNSVNEFTGYWTTKDGSGKTKWTGKGECLLIKY